MPGPRKVRIFHDVKKSPNWYVEWRDVQGRRHCESCGPKRADAEDRRQQIEDQLRLTRTLLPIQVGVDPQVPGTQGMPEDPGNEFSIPLVLKLGETEVPITIQCKLTQEAI